MNACSALRWLLLFAPVLPGLAQQGDSRWEFGGFGTLGVMGTDTHTMGYYRDISQPADGAIDHPTLRTDSRLGVQVRHSFSDDLSATVQVVSRLRYDGTFTPEVNWAFLKWSPLASLELRAGRLGVEFNTMGDARDVGYSYLPVRPPQELYGKFSTNTFTGLDLTNRFPLTEKVSLRIKAWAGSMVGKIPLKGSDPLRLDGNPTGGLTAELGGMAWRFKASWSTFTVKHDWPGDTPAISDILEQFAAALQEPVLKASADTLRIRNARVDYLSGMFAWERGPLQFQVELERATSPRAIFPSNGSGAATLGYRLGAVVPFGQVARVYSRHSSVDLGTLPGVPVQGPLIAGFIQSALHATHLDQTTFSVGARWDFMPKACLKFQVDQLKSHDSNGFFYLLEPGWNGRTRVFSLTLDFMFGGGRR